MHVVDITMFYAAQGGGITTYLHAKAGWLARQHGMRHTILSPNVRRGVATLACPAEPAYPAVVGLPGIALPGMHGYRAVRSIGAAARAIVRLRPGLVEAGDAAQGAWAALRASGQLQVPAVAFYHSDLHGLAAHSCGKAAAAVTARYLRQLYRRFDLVLAPSKIMQAHLHGLGLRGVVHQPLGVDCAVFHPGRRDAALRAQLGLAAGTRLLVYAGRFTPQKKLPLLTAAVQRLGQPYHLLLIGGAATPLRSAQISVLPFHANQRALARLLASCDLMVHPGDQETFGLAAIEAMACGVPVLGTGGGVAELIDAATGLVAPPDSVDGLCQGVEALFQQDLAVLGQHARAKARALYDWNYILPQLAGRYAALLAAPGRLASRPEPSLVRD